MAISEDKKTLRLKMRDLRSSMHLVKRAGDELSLCEKLMSLPAVRNSKVVGVYQAFGSELSLENVVEELRRKNPQIKIAYPAIIGKGLMQFASVASDETPAFVENPKCEVSQNDDYKWVDPASFDLVLVPGLAFDEHCNRLGQGGGYYDRFIPKLGADSMTIGIAFDEQIIDEVPMSKYDKGVDYVVTPSRLITRY